MVNSRNRFEAVVEAAYDGIISVDENQNIKLINRAACDIFTARKENLMGRSLEQLIPHKHRSHHKRYVSSFGESPVSSRPMESQVSVRGLRADGTEFPAEVTIAKISVGGNTEFTAVVRDIPERARLIDELQKAATEDPLTGVSNRRFLEETLNRELERCRRFGHSISVVMIDLDNFKVQNDTYGHHFGDEILVTFTRFIGDRLREVDILGRWGGDEFLVVLPQSRVEDAVQWVERIRREMTNVANQLSHPEAQISASFGVVDSFGEESVEGLVERVDNAMYRDKSGTL
ncbi:sensor domain-containing diguanylate cyclase [Amphritea sp. HPY]|uniref:sensor domain-containing diguanylate cyclase n=1 Tax=Amphritea sp. HPY TaxID=3421652 RepID=UPI003D7EC624